MQELPTLETERLILRPFTLADAPDVRRLAGEKAIAVMTARIPHPYGEGVAEEWISLLGAKNEAGTELTFAITRREDGALMGVVSLFGIAPGHMAELGYWVGVPYWNQGYCTEAARAMLAHAFGPMALQRVHAHHIARNPASGRVMQKLGMTQEGILRRHACREGRFDDAVFYGILAEEWRGGESA